MSGGAGALDIMARGAYEAFLAGGHPSLDLLPSWQDQSEDVREHWREQARETFGPTLLRLYEFWEESLEAGLQQQAAERRQMWFAHLGQRVRAELHGETPDTLYLAGSLGEAICNETGLSVLEGADPEQVAEGIAKWIEGCSA